MFPALRDDLPDHAAQIGVGVYVVRVGFQRAPGAEWDGHVDEGENSTNYGWVEDGVVGVVEGVGWARYSTGLGRKVIELEAESCAADDVERCFGEDR